MKLSYSTKEPNKVWHMIAYIIYLITDGSESISRFLHFGNNPGGESSKALDVAEASENLRIQWN